MTGQAFAEWREGLGADQQTAAQMLDADEETIAGYESGAVAVPHVIALACLGIADQCRRMTGRNKGPYEAFVLQALKPIHRR